MNWIKLTDKNQIDTLIDNGKQALIFKHSTRCPISSMAKRSFEANYEVQENVDTYFLDLIAFREVSNYVADRFSIEHASPQLLLIKDGSCVLDTSHENIDADSAKDYFTN